jgi:hypothetical protein
MVAAFTVSIVLQRVFHFNENVPEEFAYLLLITVSVTTLVWLTVTFLTPPEPRSVLLSFYRRVRPNVSGWKPIAAEASDIVPQHDGLFNLVNWISGVVMIYAFLFGLGKIILGDPLTGLAFLAAGLVAGAIIYLGMGRRGWRLD